MKYYDSTSGKVRDTMKDEFIPGYSNKKTEIFRGIFAALAISLMVITVILQFVWLNIILHCILCSFIIALCTGMLVCDIILRDKKYASVHGSWIFLWVLNIFINLANHFGL